MANERQQSAGYGGAGAGRGKSKGGPSLGGQSKGPGSGAKGSPRTKHVGSISDYAKTRYTPKVMDYVPSVANKAVTGKFFASEPEYRQMREIKEAYQGYKASPPHAGMTGRKASAQHKGMNRPEVAAAVQKASLRPERPQSKPQFGSDVHRQQKREQMQEFRKETSRLPSGWSPPRKDLTREDLESMRKSVPSKSVKTSKISRSAPKTSAGREHYWQGPRGTIRI